VVSPVVALASATTRYVSPFGTDTGDCSDPAAPCATVQYAVDQAAPSGDTISLAAGAYVEQVVITKTLTVVGAGRDESVIGAPASLTIDTSTNNTYIVEITGGSTVVSMSKLTVAGPGPQGGGSLCAPNALSLDKGITVFGGATLNLSSAAVRHVYDRPASGCQRGDAISIGSACFTCTPDVGHATLNSVIISVYQKNGVAVRGTGSTLNMSHSRVTNNASPVIASNGVEVLGGAVGVISSTSVSGNKCNAGACGPDPFNDTQASGILILHAGAGTQILNSTATGNDMGVYTDDGIKINHVHADNNRYVGIFVDSDAANGLFTFDTANTGIATSYGVITISGHGNRFANITAIGNSHYDMDAGSISGPDTNHYASNTCNNANPFKAYWHCA
jgi:hypothetical protein